MWWFILKWYIVMKMTTDNVSNKIYISHPSYLKLIAHPGFTSSYISCHLTIGFDVYKKWSAKSCHIFFQKLSRDWAQIKVHSNNITSNYTWNIFQMCLCDVINDCQKISDTDFENLLSCWRQFRCWNLYTVFPAKNQSSTVYG